jgi:hypothetical protein
VDQTAIDSTAVPDHPRERRKKPPIAPSDPRIRDGHDRIKAHWRGVGSLEPDLLTYIVNPQFQGAPAWPNTRQAFAVVRTATSLVLSSDGLSDPYVGSSMDERSGLGMEVFLEIVGAHACDFGAIKGLPEFALIEMVARNIAGHGGVRGLLDTHGLLSMALPMDSAFHDGWCDEDGQVGVLLGLNTPGIPDRLDLPFGSVRMVAVTPLRPIEARSAARSAAERAHLASCLTDRPTGHRFDRERASVLWTNG